MKIPARSLLGSTALHVGVLCGIGVWVGTGHGAALRPDVRFRIDQPPVAATVVEVARPAVEILVEVASASEPLPEPVLVPPDPTTFGSAPPAPRDPQAVDARPPFDPQVRVRPVARPDPVVLAAPPLPPPAAFVEAVPRDDRNRPPVYPRVSVARGEAGELLLRLAIDAGGVVTDVVLERGCGYPRLHRAAIEAAWRWTFEPARRDGVPVASDKRVPIEFRLTR